MHEKKERRCVACRNSSCQDDMLRLARVSGVYQFDENQKMGGRGAYVCKNKDCMALTLKKRLFNKAFKCNLPQEVYLKLEEIMSSL